MYPASAEFITAIKSNVRHIHWNGSIDLDTPITFDDKNIVSCNVLRSISGNKLDIGTVYSAQITAELILPSVSRYELYGRTTEVFVTVDDVADVIPMGVYTITEATQTADHISIKGYDDMVKFEEVPFVPSAHTEIQNPYAWLVDACTACGVVLGNTLSDISGMPNGKRSVGYADVVADVKTWRDVLGYISSLLGGYCYIGRDRKLYIGLYSNAIDDTVPASFRSSSNLSDYRTTYNGIRNIFKEDAIQEYTSNENEDGLVLDLGTNPFMQFTKDTNRIKALQEIIDVWNDVYYVPFNATMPLIPTYDAGDVLKFVDNQADQYDIGVITEITYSTDGSMTVKCSGDNPQLASAQDRFAKSVSGLSSEYSNTRNIGNKEFWIISTTNTDAITVGSTEIQITEIEWQQNTYVQDIEMLLTVDALLSATADVQIRMNVDDSVDYEMLVTESKSLIGERVFHCTNPQKVTGTGTHTAKVYMTVTDIPLKVGDLV